MSYCVNCGVELADSQKECPLCHTRVYHPERVENAGEAAFPKHVEHVYRKIDRRYGALLALIALAIPVLCSIFVDLFVVHELRWSIYATGGAVCIFIWVLFPMLLKKPNPYLHVLYNTASLLLFLAGILATAGNMHAFYWLAAPLALLCCGAAYGSLPIIRSKRLHDSLMKPAILLFMSSILCIVVELVVDMYTTQVFAPVWSLIAASSAIVTAIMLIMIERKQQLKDKIRRRLMI